MSVRQSLLAGIMGGAPAPSYTGPLDIVPGAVVAYSMRALTRANGWLGSNDVVTLRRSSDNDLRAFPTTLTGDLDTAAVAAWLGANDAFCVAWDDQSGNSNHLVQLTGANQPQWEAALNSDKPSLLFDPSTSIVGSSNNIVFGPDVTVFQVVRPAVIEGAGVFLETVTSGAGWANSNGGMRVALQKYVDADLSQFSIQYLDDQNGSGVDSVTFSGPLAALNGNSAVVIDFSLHAASGWLVPANALMINNSPSTTNHGTIADFNSLTWPLALGNSDATDNGGAYDGQYSEYIVYLSALSDADRLAIRQNIAAWYGITLS